MNELAAANRAANRGSHRPRIGTWTKATAAATVMVLSVGATSIASAVGTSTVGDLVSVSADSLPPKARPMLAWAPMTAAARTPTPTTTAASPAEAAQPDGPDRTAEHAPAAAPTNLLPTVSRTPASTERVNPWLAPTMALPDPATAATVGEGDETPQVLVLERRLQELGYRPGLLDGYFSGSTWSALLAFQKAEGLARTGEADAATWARLAAPHAWRTTSSITYPRVEIDIDRQVLLVVFGPEHVITLNTSTGGGYEYTNQYGGLEVAETPIGAFNVYRRYDGLEKAPLGSLYRPLYFEQGYAIHGATYVPDFPDSHGCARISYEDADWLWDLAPNDLQVTVFQTMDPATLFPGTGRHGAPGLPPRPKPEAMPPQ